MLPNGQKMYKSLIGAILTVVAVTLVAFYAVYKLEVLISQEETAITKAVQEGANTEAIFNSTAGFFLAVGLNSGRSIRSIEQTDETFGRIELLNLISERDAIERSFKRLKMRSCDSSDLATESWLDDPSEDISKEAFIYPIDSGHRVKLEKVIDKFQCLDEDDFFLKGKLS